MSGRPPPANGAALLVARCCGVLDLSQSSEALEKLSNADRKASLKRCEAKASASLFSARVAKTRFTTQPTSSSAGFFSSDKAPPHRSAASAASASKVSSCAIKASGASDARNIKCASCSPTTASEGTWFESMGLLSNTSAVLEARRRGDPSACSAATAAARPRSGRRRPPEVKVRRTVCKHSVCKRPRSPGAASRCPSLS
mmetsp:Transcript_12838/g.28296  ORF Transcript_12838/g.28296 Transcript_12838/m.28296 type:complete len:200 (+) Transcript_12838:1843-2442(+)